MVPLSGRSMLQDAQKGWEAREVDEQCVFVGRVCLIVDSACPMMACAM